MFDFIINLLPGSAGWVHRGKTMITVLQYFSDPDVLLINACTLFSVPLFNVWLSQTQMDFTALQNRHTFPKHLVNWHLQYKVMLAHGLGISVFTELNWGHFSHLGGTRNGTSGARIKKFQKTDPPN